MTYEGNKRKKAEKDRDKKSNAEAVKLIISASLVAAAAIMRFLFPNELGELRSEVLSAVSVSIPYREAVSALGSAIGRGEGVAEAAKTAWSIASGEIRKTEDTKEENFSEYEATNEKRDIGEARAKENGSVIAVGESSVFGSYVVLRGESGDEIYDGLSEISVEEGTEVRKGDLLGMRKAGTDAAEG